MRKTLDLGKILKDALVSAVISLFLAVPLLGMETFDAGGKLGVRSRWWLVGVAVASVFVVRILMNVWLSLRPVKVKKTVNEASIRRGQIIIKAPKK